MKTTSTKQSGTKTATKGTLAKVQAKAAKRTTKIAAKHEAIRQAAAHTPPAAANANPLLAGGDFTDALNAASVAQLEEALQHPGLSNQCRNRIGIALKLRSEPAKAAPTDDVAKTVAAVQKGDLTKDVEILMPAKKAGKAPKAAKKLSGLGAAARVLVEAGKAMKAGEIVEAMTTKGYWTSKAGKTPAATIYAAIITHIAKKGTDSMFARGEVKGTFVATAAAGQPAQAKSVQVVTVPGKKA
jgi:hypothetical protein